MLIYFGVLCCYLLEACYYLLRDRNRMDPDRREGGAELGGVDRREIIIRIDYGENLLWIEMEGRFPE